ncbi:MAG: T9SS type A sorting domain-containing protein [Chitinophagales bacterium]|nr:T9SS type A sorting domain-containing protein [Chitinophagales bacterium]
MRSILIFLLNLSFLTSFAQLTIIVDSVPPNTPAVDNIYIAGDFQGWDPGDIAYRLTYDTVESKYWITINPTPPTIKYKFTRGSWTSVEGNENGGFRPDRTLSFANGDTAYHTVLSWEDLGGGGGCNSTAGPTVTVYDSAFFIPQLNRFRRVWVYLPSDYNSTNRRYQTLYIHDAQNVFDDCTSFIGEWEVDESLDALELAGDSNIIVVGIDNGGVERIDEYSPWINTSFGGGDGDDYMKFIVETLKPNIDSNFRTKPQREFTGLMGSSMGGLISFYGVLKYQDVFSKGGIFSPSFWFAPDSLMHFMKDHPKTHDIKFYMLMGGMEGSNPVNTMLSIADSLKTIGFSESEIMTSVPADGQHSEWFWKREFPSAYQWLYWNKISSIYELVAANSIQLYPNPASTQINLIGDNRWSRIQVFDLQGNLVIQTKRDIIPISHLVNGIYLLRASGDSGIIYRSRFIKVE